MELTPENLDDMDCRPLRDVPGISVSHRLQKLVAEREAARAAKEVTRSKKPLEAAE